MEKGKKKKVKKKVKKSKKKEKKGESFWKDKQLGDKEGIKINEIKKSLSN